MRAPTLRLRWSVEVRQGTTTKLVLPETSASRPKRDHNLVALLAEAQAACPEVLLAPTIHSGCLLQSRADVVTACQINSALVTLAEGHGSNQLRAGAT